MKHKWPDTKIEQKFGTYSSSFQPRGHTGSDFPSSFDKAERTMKNGMTAVGIIFLLVALALTIVSIVLAVNVSGWFFIATVILGGYTLAATVMVVLQRKMMNSMRDW